ncbi:MAG: NfeD family protein [Bacilli bacterium]|jgi:membrane protein implicated in regulation of membrane protease activity|nr:NfeD family protein [Erysipelotrichia bacterium]
MGIEEVMVWIWLGVFVISIVIEALEPGLISIWFAGGAILALILSIIPGVPFWVEIIVFIIASVTLIFSIRPLTKKYLLKKETKSNVEEKIGEKCTVLVEVNELSHGEVQLNGIIWTAVAKNKGDVFLKDEVVVIVGIDGNKLVIDKDSK